MDTGIRQARAKTDRLDARVLARLLWSGELDGVWTPDERVRAMRRRLSHRAGLVGVRTRAKNEVHAALLRCLKDRPPVADVFRHKGRRWLAEQVLPVAEQETVDAAVRQVDFLDREVAEVEKLIAAEALSWPEGQAADDRPRRQGSVRRSYVKGLGIALAGELIPPCAYAALAEAAFEHRTVNPRQMRRAGASPSCVHPG
jgi:transposase